MFKEKKKRQRILIIYIRTYNTHHYIALSFLAQFLNFQRQTGVDSQLCTKCIERIKTLDQVVSSGTKHDCVTIVLCETNHDCETIRSAYTKCKTEWCERTHNCVWTFPATKIKTNFAILPCKSSLNVEGKAWHEDICKPNTFRCISQCYTADGFGRRCPTGKRAHF